MAKTFYDLEKNHDSIMNREFCSYMNPEYNVRDIDPSKIYEMPQKNSRQR